MLDKGERAPDFTLPDQDGRERTLSSLLEGEALILYFYPADFTPGCTREACDLRDLHTQILAAGLHVVGVSPQSPDSHRRFRDEYGLPRRIWLSAGTGEGTDLLLQALGEFFHQENAICPAVEEV